MQIAFWSNMHGQGAVTANAVAASCLVAQKTSYRTLVAQNHVELNALEHYLLRRREQAAISLLDYTNLGLDALVRLYKNGRLRPDMIPDYTWSLMKNHGLDLLFRSEKRENLRADSQDMLLNIFLCAKECYDVIILDLHSGLDGTNSLRLLETSDVIVFCLCQNRLLLEDFRRKIDENPALAGKRCAYVISRYEPAASLTLGNLSRKYRLDSKSLFAIPYHAGFMDACNSGRVFDFMAYCLEARKGADYAFAQAFSELADYVMKGCERCSQTLSTHFSS